MKKKLIAGLVIVAVLGTGGWWVLSRRADRAAARNAVQYVQEPVRRSTIRAQVSGSGPVRSVNGVTVKATQSGTVAQILAKDGDRVQAGQPIIRLESPTLLSSLSQAQLDLQNARINLDGLVSPQATAVRAQELKVENARIALKQRQEDLANLQVVAPAAGVIASVAAVEGGSVSDNTLLFTLYDESTPTLILPLPQETAGALYPGQKAQVTLPGHGSVEGVVSRQGGTASPVSGNRDASLSVAIDLPPLPSIRPGMVAQVTIDAPRLPYRIQGNGSVENDVEEIRARVAGTATQIAVVEGQRVAAGQPLLTIENEGLLLQLEQAANDLKSQEEALTSLVDPAQDPSGQLATYQQKLQQAQLTLSQRQADVDELQVKAPVAGTLSALTPVVGERVNSGANLFRVADYNAMEVTISVDELDVAQIKVGQPAVITLDALPGKTYRGKVSKLNPEGIFKNDIATFEVTVAIEQPEGLMAGMNASVNITVMERENVLHLPVSAVRVTRGQATVQVLEQNQVVQKEVVVGIKTNDRYELISGLNEGDQVITTIVRPQSGLPMGPGGGFPGPGGGGGQRMAPGMGR